MIAHYYHDVVGSYWPGPPPRRERSRSRVAVADGRRTGDRHDGIVDARRARRLRDDVVGDVVDAVGPAPLESFRTRLAAVWPDEQRRTVTWPLTSGSHGAKRRVEAGAGTHVAMSVAMLMRFAHGPRNHQARRSRSVAFGFGAMRLPGKEVGRAKGSGRRQYGGAPRDRARRQLHRHRLVLRSARREPVDRRGAVSVSERPRDRDEARCEALARQELGTRDDTRRAARGYRDRLAYAEARAATGRAICGWRPRADLVRRSARRPHRPAEGGQDSPPRAVERHRRGRAGAREDADRRGAERLQLERSHGAPREPGGSRGRARAVREAWHRVLAVLSCSRSAHSLVAAVVRRRSREAVSAVRPRKSRSRGCSRASQLLPILFGTSKVTHSRRTLGEGRSITPCSTTAATVHPHAAASR